MYFPVLTHETVAEGTLYLNSTVFSDRSFMSLTLRARIGTRSLSSSIPGMITVIFLGPLKPRTFVSCKVQNYREKTMSFKLGFESRSFAFRLIMMTLVFKSTHIDDCSKFLSSIGHVSQGSVRIQTIIKHSEFGAHKI